MIKKTGEIIIQIARSPLFASAIGIIFRYFSQILPVKRLYENNNVLIFEHPSKYWNIHYLIVPKYNIQNILLVNINNHKHLSILQDIFIAIQYIIKSDKNGHKDLQYTVVCNAGMFQDVPQLHFHFGIGGYESGRPNKYQKPEVGNQVFSSKACKVNINNNPSFIKDYLLTLNNCSCISFESMDFSDHEQIKDVIVDLFQFLNQNHLESFSLQIHSADIMNFKTFMVRILSGRRID